MDFFRSTFGVKHRSWPAFWQSGTVAALLFIVMGPVSLIMNMKRGDAGTEAIFAGVFITLLGIGLLIAVIYTKTLLSDDDLSLQIDLSSGGKRKKYDPIRVIRYLSDQHNNVAIVKTDNEMVRIFSAEKVFVVEVTFFTESDFSTFHMIDPDVEDITPVVLRNIVLEEIPVRRNLLVNREAAQAFLNRLYEEKNARSAMEGFSFLDTSEETKRLVEKDAYIVPSIPVDLPDKDSERDAWMKRKEEKLQRAIKELRNSEKNT